MKTMYKRKIRKKKKKHYRVQWPKVLKEVFIWGFLILLIIAEWKPLEARSENNVEIITGYISDVTAEKNLIGSSFCYRLFFSISGRRCYYTLRSQELHKKENVVMLVTRLRELEKKHTKIEIWIADYTHYLVFLEVGMLEPVVAINAEDISFPVSEYNKERLIDRVVYYAIMAICIAIKLILYFLS